jgi:uncharacterized membrane protein
MDAIFPGLEAAPNVHPLLVHFPIALWPTALLLLAFAYLYRDDEAFRFGRWILHLGVLAGVAAGISGWIASEGMGHDGPAHHLVHDHRNFMVAALIVAALAAGLAHWTRETARSGRRWAPLGLLLVACLLTALGADRGGLLVYGHGVGVDTTPRATGASSQHPETTAAHSHEGHSH